MQLAVAAHVSTVRGTQAVLSSACNSTSHQYKQHAIPLHSTPLHTQQRLPHTKRLQESSSNRPSPCQKLEKRVNTPRGSQTPTSSISRPAASAGSQVLAVLASCKLRGITHTHMQLRHCTVSARYIGHTLCWPHTVFITHCVHHTVHTGACSSEASRQFQRPHGSHPVIIAVSTGGRQLA